jgi:hypothetical protein
VRQERNSGLAAALNTAFRVARGEFCSIVGRRLRCGAGVAREARGAYERCKDRGCRRILARRRTGFDCRSLARAAAHMPQEWGGTVLRNPQFLFGCNNIFRRAAVLDAGRYDETMRTNGEDCELSRQPYAKRGEQCSFARVPSLSGFSTVARIKWEIAERAVRGGSLTACIF